MTTPRQLAANRANARKSTGPRTVAGKARSARNSVHSTGLRTPEGQARSRWNALRHDMRSGALIPEGLHGQESPAEYAALHEALRGELAPAGAFEELLAKTIAAAYWRLGRLQAAESRGILTARSLRRADLELLASPAGLSPDPAPPADGDALLPEHITLPALDEILVLMRYEAHLERQVRRAYDLLERARARRRAQAEPPAPGPVPAPGSKAGRSSTVPSPLRGEGQGEGRALAPADIPGRRTEARRGSELSTPSPTAGRGEPGAAVSTLAGEARPAASPLPRLGEGSGVRDALTSSC